MTTEPDYRTKTEEEYDRVSDLNADRLRYIMRDSLGITNPNQHVRLTTIGTRRIAIVDPWPVGVDKRRADQLALAAGLEVVHDAPIGPYGSCYLICNLWPV